MAATVSRGTLLVFALFLPHNAQGEALVEDIDGGPEVRHLEEEFRIVHPRMNKQAIEEAKFDAIIVIGIFFLALFLLVIGCVFYLRRDTSGEIHSVPHRRGKNFEPWRHERDFPSTKYEINE